MRPSCSIHNHKVPFGHHSAFHGAQWFLLESDALSFSIVPLLYLSWQGLHPVYLTNLLIATKALAQKQEGWLHLDTKIMLFGSNSWWDASSVLLDKIPHNMCSIFSFCEALCSSCPKLTLMVFYHHGLPLLSLTSVHRMVKKCFLN